MGAHEAGAAHEAANHEPRWLREPDDVDALLEPLWPVGTCKVDGVLRLGGVDVRDIARKYGTPAYVVDESDFRARARAFREAFEREFPAGVDVYYAGKAFLCTAVARWIAAEGLSLDVCTGGELAVALAAGTAADRIAMHGNNKSTAELARALEVGVGRIVLDSFDEIDRLAKLTADRDRRQRVLVRVTTGVEAHTHEYIATAHEDQKFGFSLANGEAESAVRRVLAADGLEFAGLHSHIGSQIFDASAFEVAAHRVLGLAARIHAEAGVASQEVCLGGGFGIAYTSQDDPASPEVLASALRKIVEAECRLLRIRIPRISIEPGRAIAGPAGCTLYEVGTVKSVQVAADSTRLYVSVDGGMSDNIRSALYGAAYSATLASRRAQGRPVLSRIVGKHCESGDVVVRDEFLPQDVAAGDLIAVPGTGAYCRSMASNYNHVPRPPVLAVHDGRVAVLIRRETEEDLLGLDVGFDGSRS